MRKYQIINCILYLIATSVLVALTIRASDWHLIYTLDDPYIHLAVAENVLRGGYGVNLNEFSSPSSSIIWPFLLTLPLLLGLGTWSPLVIGVIANSISLWLISGFFWRYAIGTKPFSGELRLLILVSPLLILAINAAALPMTGMEHPLHVLGCVFVILGLTEMAQDKRVPAMLIIGIVMCPLARFEGLALSLGAIGAMVYERHFSAAFGTAAVLSGAIILYAIIMTSLGLPALPSSVLVKSGVAAAALDGSMMSAARNALGNLYSSLGNRWGALFLASSGLLLLSLAREPPADQRIARIVAIPAVIALFAHLLFGRYGWFGRYEVYAVTTMLLSLVVVYSSTLIGARNLTIKILSLGLLLEVLAHGYAGVTRRTPAAARNIYEQQYQMHRFATNFFPYAVAVNDLGWVAYRNDNYVLDLWGLGSEESRQLARTGQRSSAAISRLVSEKGVYYAMLYDHWFGDTIPAAWCRIAALRTSRVASARREVSFYLLKESKVPEMTAALVEFRSSLPRGVELEVFGCPSWEPLVS